MDGLIEQMLDGLFRMAEKVTRAPSNLPQKGEATKKMAEKEEGTQQAIAKSEERTNGRWPEGKAIVKSEERKVPVRKRRRQRVKMVEGMLFE